jgi:hypothetical protein
MGFFLDRPRDPEERALHDATMAVRRAIGLTAVFGAEGGDINCCSALSSADDSVGVRIEVGDDWAFVPFTALSDAKSPADVRGVLAAALPAHAALILARRSPDEARAERPPAVEVVVSGEASPVEVRYQAARAACHASATALEAAHAAFEIARAAFERAQDQHRAAFDELERVTSEALRTVEPAPMEDALAWVEEHGGVDRLDLFVAPLPIRRRVMQLVVDLQRTQAP